METIGNILGDREITWDIVAKLKLAQFHGKHLKIDTVWSNIMEDSIWHPQAQQISQAPLQYKGPFQ